MTGSFKIKAILGTIVVLAGLTLLLFWQPGGQKSSTNEGDALILFCAAGVKPPVEAVALEYEKEYGVPISIQYGGSGTLLSNLQVAKTGDLYLAADNSYIEIAREKNLLAEDLPIAYQRPVIAVAVNNPKNILSPKDLLRADVKVALGNPDAASIGKQTKIALTEAGLWDQVEKAIQKNGVFKPTVNDVANDIKLGTVDAGVIWDTTAHFYPEIDVATYLTDDEKFRMEVSIGVLSSCRRPTEALRFARYLAARDKGLLEFKKYGFFPVDGDTWKKNPEIVLLSGGVNRPAIEETIAAFETREGCKVTRSYNGCGILVAQMKAGERPDAYFACDVSFMSQVQDLFLDPIDVSETDIVITVPKGNPKGIKTLQDLAGEGLKLGMTNPKQSALGALTVRMLKAAGLFTEVDANVRSRTPTADLLVNQLRTGSLDAIIVYEANVAHVLDHIEIVRINLPTATAIQPIAVGQNSQQKYITQRLIDAISSDESRERYLKTGFRWLLDSEK